MRQDRFGSLGSALAMMAALHIAAKQPRPEPTPAQKQRQAARNEREEWNEQVDAKKASKRERKAP